MLEGINLFVAGNTLDVGWFASSLVAYLDPGMGSYALQVLLATLFGGMFALKQSWSELKLWVSCRFGNAPRPTGPVSAQPATGVRPIDNARPKVHDPSTVESR